MKQISAKVLLTMLALSAAQVQAVRYTNKTTVSLRPQGLNAPMAKSLSHRLQKADGEKCWNGKVQASAFFQRSENTSDLARLLLFNKKNTVGITRRGLAAPVPVVPAGEVDFGYLVHSNSPVTETAGSMRHTDGAFNLKLAPERTSYGLHLGYEHDLGNLIKGLSFQVSAPVVHIQHHLNKTITSANADTQTNVEKYFTGKFQQAAGGANSQDFLKKALLLDQRAIGVADIELEMNYNAIHRAWGCWHLGVGLTVPTGNTTDGTYAFQPVVGNNGHIGVGGQSSMVLDVLSHGSHHLSLHGNARYRYLLESDEVRTLGIKDRNFGQYHLLAKTGDVRGSMLRPAANELTLAVDVTPGHQFDGTVSLAYSWRKLSIDLGYNLYFRNDESLRLRNAFADNTYAIVKRDYEADAATAANNDVGTAQTNFQFNTPLRNDHTSILDGGFPAGVVNADKLDLRAASDERQMSHALFASVGLAMNGEETPVVAGLGGSYEFAGANNGLEQWTLWVKAGISF